MRTAEHLTMRVRRSWRLLVKELGAFGVVGAVCFLVDLGLFQLLYVGAGIGPVVAKLISTVTSMTLAYVGHRNWSFSHRARTGVGREYSIFFAVNGVTMCLGLAAVAVAAHVLGQHDPLILQAVNVGSIAVGTLIRFLAYRRWVFVAEDSPVALAHRENQARHAAPASIRLPA
jgi:putative flippase GtrA